jgi:hypothetical protein
MSTTLIPSTTGPTKAWAASFLKSPGRPGYWSAVEVEVEPKRPGDQFTGYRFDLYGARRVRGEPVPPPCTQKRQDAAYEAFVATLRAQNLIGAQA